MNIEYTEEELRSLALIRQVHELAVSAASQHNQYFTYDFTPQALAHVVMPKGSGPSKTHVLVGSEGYISLMSNKFIAALCPKSRQELMATGVIAEMYGITIGTDRFFHPRNHVIPASAVYVFALDVDGNVLPDVTVLRIEH